jgi:hypothetical protein
MTEGPRSELILSQRRENSRKINNEPQDHKVTAQRDKRSRVSNIRTKNNLMYIQKNEYLYNEILM